jgi:flagellar motor switch protein FliN/FliY
MANTDTSNFQLANSRGDEDDLDKPSNETAGVAAAGQSVKTDYSRIGKILDVPLKVTVEVGQVKMLAHEILEFTPGKVLELSKLAGEAMEILLNDKLIALGEVVVVNEKYGVRLTDVISGIHQQTTDR